MIARLSWESSGRSRKSRAKAVTLNQNNTEHGGGETVFFSGSAGFGDELTFSQAMSNRLQLQPRLGMQHPPHITETLSGKPSTPPVSTVTGTVPSQVGDTRTSDWFRWPY